MFEKFTFEKKLGINSNEKRFRGLKIATVSALLAFLGALFIALEMSALGKVIVFLGIVGGFVGLMINVIVMFGQSGKNKN